jgi:hypothetical protein
MQPQNHACRFEKIFKTKLQAFGRSDPETLRSQNHRRFKIRLLVKGLQVVHGQLSKLYKNRFHELLEHRAYRSEKMNDTTRKALLKCAELLPELDEWHDHLDEDRRLQLNHPVCVLRAFRESQNYKPASRQSRRAQHEVELEKVRQEAATAVSSQDELIEEKQQQIDQLLKQNDSPRTGDNVGSDIEDVVQYVVVSCKTEQRIRDVIDGLNRYLEQLQS